MHRRNAPIAALLIALAVSTASTFAQEADNPDPTTTSAFADGVAGYIYAYPLVLMGITERVVSSVSNATFKIGRAPINQFSLATGLPNASYSDVVLPSTSTLYASAFLDLTNEPIVFHLPDELGHFFLMQVLDAWTNVSPMSPGSRLRSKPGDYVFTGPNWKGTDADLPPGSTRIPISTNTMWIIGRTYTSGTQADIDLVLNEIFAKYSLTPLSKLGNYTPPDNLPVDPSVDTSTRPVDQVASMDACAFFGTYAAMSITNPPLPDDSAIVGRLTSINIPPGSPFDCGSLSASQRATLQLAAAAGRTILQGAPAPSLTETNWSMPLNLGSYGRRYLLRALVALHAIGANSTADAVYAFSTQDGAGNLLTGANNYTLHFSPKTLQGLPGQVPPVNRKSFWSVTLYNSPKENLVDNNVGYNAIGYPEIQAHNACFNPDGSLDLYFGVAAPSDATLACNWIPAPPGEFLLFLRMYWPDNTITDGPWVPPAITKVN
jgi:hypothetical protein